MTENNLLVHSTKLNVMESIYLQQQSLQESKLQEYKLEKLLFQQLSVCWDNKTSNTGEVWLYFFSRIQCKSSCISSKWIYFMSTEHKNDEILLKNSNVLNLSNSRKKWEAGGPVNVKKSKRKCPKWPMRNSQLIVNTLYNTFRTSQCNPRMEKFGS